MLENLLGNENNRAAEGTWEDTDTCKVFFCPKNHKCRLCAAFRSSELEGEVHVGNTFSYCYNQWEYLEWCIPYVTIA